MRNTEPRHINLKTLIEQLKEGHFVIPDFQSDFKWRPHNIRSLMRSIFLDYYIGSFLLWKGKKNNFKLLSCKTIYGFNDKNEQMPWEQGHANPEHIVLDGRQRLTALYYAFFAPDVPLPGRKDRAVYFIHVDKFMDERYDESFQHDLSQSRSDKIMNNREFQYEKHIFPLSIVGGGDQDLRDWVRNYEEYWKKVAAEANARQDMSKYKSAKRYAKKIHAFRWHIKIIVEEYQIAYIKLGRNLAIDKACGIFTQPNIHRVQLDVFDFISSLFKPKGLQLENMGGKAWREKGSELSKIKEDKMKAYVLQTMSILLQDCCSAKDLYFLLPGQEKPARDLEGRPKKEILILDTNSFEKHWDGAFNAIKSAIEMLENPKEFGGIFSECFPSHISILPVLAALQFKRQRLLSSQQSKAQHKIRHWYWASVFTNRYSGSVESTSARDFIDVTAWIESNNREDEPALIQEFKDLFHSLDLRSRTNKGAIFYNVIFNLIILQGARDWMSGTSLKQVKSLDDHHIVPASWGKNLNDSNSINTILNRTPLIKKTNSKIGNSLPNKYLKDLIKERDIKKVHTTLKSHFISPQTLKILLRNPFTQKDYEEFIAARRCTILEAIRSILNKKQLHL